MRRIRALIVNHLWWVVLIVAAAMLAVHSLGVQRVTVDNTSLILLMLVLISPFVAAIKKIKIGEFEAEIEPEEVKRVAKEAEESLPRPSSSGKPPAIDATAAAIEGLADTDPPVALAKLRIELESRLRRLHNQIKPDVPRQNRPTALAFIIRDLTAAEIFAPEFGAVLRDVIAICNRAIHGEDIRDVDARQIVATGINVLEVLQHELLDYAAAHPVQTTPITSADREEFQRARYRLTTVVPLVDEPEQRVYELTQDGLDTFLDGYSEFAEFLVALERIP
jgi:hypothetical protein